MMASAKKLVAGMKGDVGIRIPSVPGVETWSLPIEPALMVRPALAGPDRLSASVSLASTSMVTRVSSLVLAVSLTATGDRKERRVGKECRSGAESDVA